MSFYNHNLLWIIILFFSILSGCKTTEEGKKSDATERKSSSNIGNIRVAIVGKHHQGNLLLVNEGNRLYLSEAQEPDETMIKAGEPPKDTIIKQDGEMGRTLLYRESDVFFRADTSIMIVEDGVMEQLMQIFSQYGFSQYAQPCDEKEFVRPDWPEREGIFLDKNQELSIFVRDPKLVDENKQLTQQGKMYHILKYYIIQAQNTGYRPIKILQNVDGNAFFGKGKKNLEQDVKNQKNKKK